MPKENDENVDLWHFTFDGGDWEDLARDDVNEARKQYQENAHQDTNEEGRRLGFTETGSKRVTLH